LKTLVISIERIRLWKKNVSLVHWSLLSSLGFCSDVGVPTCCWPPMLKKKNGFHPLHVIKIKMTFLVISLLLYKLQKTFCDNISLLCQFRQFHFAIILKTNIFITSLNVFLLLYKSTWQTFYWLDTDYPDSLKSEYFCCFSSDFTFMKPLVFWPTTDWGPWMGSSCADWIVRQSVSTHTYIWHLFPPRMPSSNPESRKWWLTSRCHAARWERRETFAQHVSSRRSRGHCYLLCQGSNLEYYVRITWLDPA